uniref:MFS domain-containing protein n=1 Tax=Rhabditophanes sp. KR3021 TaxID=114890 RepID=A0AC35UGT9_9BILA
MLAVPSGNNSIYISDSTNSDTENNLTITSIDSEVAREIHNVVYLSQKLVESQHLVSQTKHTKRLYKKYNFVDKALHKLNFHFFGHTRYFILLMATICMSMARSNELVFNFNVICMTNHTETHLASSIKMSSGEISTVFASSGIGTILAPIAVVYAIHYFGALAVFSSLLTFSSIATILMGYLPQVNVLWMIPLRIIQGLAAGSVMVMMGFVSSNWAPSNEVGNFLTLLSSSGQLQVLTYPMSANLCVLHGWASVFHTHGLLTLPLIGLFLIFFRDSPRIHPCVSSVEKEYITEGLSKISKKDRSHIPYKDIFRSKAIWAIWIAFLANSFGFQVIGQFMPTFLNKVLNVNIHNTGLGAILPASMQLLTKLILGAVSNRTTFLSSINKIKFFNSLSSIGGAVFLLPLAFINSDQSSIALLMFTLSLSCLGLICLGAMKSATLCARRFTDFVMAIVQIFISIGMITVSTFVSKYTTNNTIEEWKVIFFIISIILICGNIVFCIFCSDKPQPFTFAKIPNDALFKQEFTPIIKTQLNDAV